MKRYLSFIMALVLLLSSMSFSAFAVKQESKISSELNAKIEKLEKDEKIQVWIWLYCDVSIEEVWQQTYEETGLTPMHCKTTEDMDRWTIAYNRIMGELESKNNQMIIDKLGVDGEDIIFNGTMSPSMVINLSSEQIRTAASFDEVESISLYDASELIDEGENFIDEPTPLPNANSLLPAIRSYYQDDAISSSDMVIDYLVEINTSNYVVRLRINGRDYDNRIISKKIGNYRLSSYDPEPLIFDSKATLSTFDDAYKNGIINDTTLEIISGFCRNLSQSEYLRGDADGDGNFTVLDATCIQRYMAQLTRENGIDVENADADGDGHVSILDATRIQRLLAGLE